MLSLLLGLGSTAAGKAPAPSEARWVQVRADAAWHVAPDPGSVAFALGAPLDGGRAAHPGEVFAAELVELRGGWARVKTSSGTKPSFRARCAPSHLTAPFEIDAWVRTEDLSQVLTSRLAGADPAGYPRFDLFPGLPVVQDGATWVAESGPLRVRLGLDPKDLGVAWIPVEPPPVGVGPGHTLAPIALGDPTRYRIEVTEPAEAIVDDQGTWAVIAGCLAVLGKGGRVSPGAPPAAPTEATPGDAWRLAPSTPVSLATGEVIGKVTGSNWLRGREVPAEGDRRCLEWADHVVTVCVPAASITALPPGLQIYHHSELTVVRREQPHHPRSPEGDYRCLADVFLDRGGVPTRVDVMDCPTSFHDPVRDAIDRWRWEAPPRGPGVVQVGVSFKSR